MLNLLRTTGLRITLAFILSFSLWAFVSLSENPEAQVPFEGLQVEMLNLPPNLVRVDQNGLPNPALPTVNVTIATDRQTQNVLRQADLRASVDLGKLASGDFSLPVNVRPTRPNVDFSVLTINPAIISVRLEAVMTATVPITIVVQGNPPFGFERGELEPSIGGSTVTVVQAHGPQSRIERVSSAQSSVSVDQRSANYSGSVTLRPLDALGQVVEGVTLEPSTINIRIPIRSIVGLKRVPVLGKVTGLPATGFTVAGMSTEPQLINLTGSSGTLDQVEQVETAPVDITNQQGLISRTVAIRIPLGTSLQAGEPVQAVLIIDIRPLDRAFQVQLPIQVTVVGNRPDLLVSLSPAFVQATLAGKSSLLDQLDAEQLVAIIDVSGFGLGSYQLIPQMTLPDGISLAHDLSQVTVTLHLPPSPTPTSNPTPTIELRPEPLPSTTLTPPTASAPTETTNPSEPTLPSTATPTSAMPPDTTPSPTVTPPAPSTATPTTPP